MGKTKKNKGIIIKKENINRVKFFRSPNNF